MGNVEPQMQYIRLKKEGYGLWFKGQVTEAFPPEDVVSKLPWDITLTGVGEPNATTGKYSSYKATVWPGTISNIVPSNMLSEFTVGNSLTYLVLDVQASNWSVNNAMLSFTSSVPSPSEATKNAAPNSFKVVLGAVKGADFNANLVGRSFFATVSEVGKENRSNPPPNESPYDFYYQWRW